MYQKIFILSDIEMGRGDSVDDFTDDDELKAFIEKISRENKDVETLIILNGDIFDFLKMSYKGKYTRYITEEMSLWKLNETIKAHPLVFTTLQKYLQNPKHAVHFIIGNHDADLIWPALQNRLKDHLKNKNNVFFDFSFSNKDIHVEHGDLIDPFFTKNITNPIIKHKNQRILNMPFGFNICVDHLIPLKLSFPKEERIYPNMEALKSNPDFRKQSNHVKIKIVLHELLINPFRHKRDPGYQLPLRAMLGHVIDFGFDVADDDRFVEKRVKKLIKKVPDKEILVLGHSHTTRDTYIRGRRAFITDTWRNEVNALENHCKKPKTYVEITYNNLNHPPEASLKIA